MADFFLGITLPGDFTEEVESLRRRFAAPRTRPHITLIDPRRENPGIHSGDERRRRDIGRDLHLKSCQITYISFGNCQISPDELLTCQGVEARSSGARPLRLMLLCQGASIPRFPGKQTLDQRQALGGTSLAK